jgi:hypothetical protein
MSHRSLTIGSGELCAAATAADGKGGHLPGCLRDGSVASRAGKKDANVKSTSCKCRQAKASVKAGAPCGRGFDTDTALQSCRHVVYACGSVPKWLSVHMRGKGAAQRERKETRRNVAAPEQSVVEFATSLSRSVPEMTPSSASSNTSNGCPIVTASVRKAHSQQRDSALASRRSAPHIAWSFRARSMERSRAIPRGAAAAGAPGARSMAEKFAGRWIVSDPGTCAQAHGATRKHTEARPSSPDGTMMLARRRDGEESLGSTRKCAPPPKVGSNLTPPLSGSVTLGTGRSLHEASAWMTRSSIRATDDRPSPAISIWAGTPLGTVSVRSARAREGSTCSSPSGW